MNRFAPRRGVLLPSDAGSARSPRLGACLSGAARLRAVRLAGLVRLVAARKTQPLAQPGCEIALREPAFGEGDHRNLFILVGRDEFGAVQRKKSPVSNVRGT
ncbi:MAG: hypothetical protein K2Y16_15550, partial [Burkholderiales bacterium]|nr:hypothetical protein [Burkholderiales bacterium]